MMIPQLTSATPLDNYRLLLSYNTSESRIFDVTPYIIGSWYGQLKEVSYFKCIRIVGNTVEWPDGQDLAPHELYENSLQYTAELVEMMGMDGALINAAQPLRKDVQCEYSYHKTAVL